MDDPKENQDTSQKEDSFGTTEGTSTEPETFTKKTQEKAVSDALSAAGRDAKSIKGKTDEADRLIGDAKKMMEATKEAEAKWRKARDDAELESHRDEPDVIKSIQARQKLQEKEAELLKREQELNDSKKGHQDALDELAASKKERNALEIALKHGVPFEKLLKFTDGSTEQMEELAQSLPKQRGELKTPGKPDSNKTIGGGELSAEQKLKARYPTMK